MKNNKWCVYKHTSPSKGVYIGITKQNPVIRWSNGSGYKRNPYFYKAIQKYGWDNFKHEILFSNLTQEEAERYEKNLISEYRNGGKCYNILDGGLAAVVDTSKKVYQYTLEGKFLKEWTSATEAAKFYKVTQSTITKIVVIQITELKLLVDLFFSYNKTSKKDPIISVSTKAVNQYDLHMNLIKNGHLEEKSKKTSQIEELGHV